MWRSPAAWWSVPLSLAAMLKGCLLSLLLASVSTAAFAQHVLATINVCPYPTGIAVNERTNMIYVSCPAFLEDIVNVIDGATNSLVATIPAGREPWQIWVYAPENLIYVYNQLDGTVTVIDGNTNTVTKTVTTGFTIDAATVLGNQLYVASNGAQQIHAVDMRTLTSVADITLPAKPYYITSDSAANLVYVSYGTPADRGTSVTVINATTNSIVNTFSAGAEVNIFSVSADSANHLLYATTASAPFPETVTVFDDRTGVVLGATPALGTVVDLRALPRMKKAVAAGGKSKNGEAPHSLMFIDGTTFGVTKVVQVGSEPFALGLNALTGHVFVDNYLSSSVSVVGP